MKNMPKAAPAVNQKTYRQLLLDVLATWRGFSLRRADRIISHMEANSVSDETLNAASDEMMAIMRFLAAAGRVK
jgi:hypothetical protein